jgi:hypothetical protein
MKSRHVTTALAIVTFATFATEAMAQNFQVKGGGGGGASPYVLNAENNTTNNSDVVGARGYSVPAPYYGLGGDFTGGYIGVRGYSTVSGTGSRYGGYFSGSGGATNYGIYATSPGWAGYFNGNVYISGNLTQASDEHLKLNIKDLDSTLGRVRKLRPKTYSFRQDSTVALSLPEGTQHGFSAQELREVFPDLVKDVPATTPSKGATTQTTLSVNYVAMIPILVKALQEQQAEIDDLKALLGKK